MRFLHTSDWHVGKILKGHDRLPEQREVLAEVVRIAAEQSVDAVLVAGDLYETATPGPDAQQLVVQTLLALRDTGASVVAIAGNHDNPAMLDAYRPLAGAAGITLVGRVRRPADGGVVTLTARSDGAALRVAAVPFLSQRWAVRSAELLTSTPAENSAGYDAWVRRIVGSLAAGFADDAVNVVLAHLTVTGATLGGGERQAQSIFEYHVPATAFPAETHYVALGHLHRRQSVPAPCPVHYCGSPLRIDFGEVDSSPVVLVVDAAPGVAGAGHRGAGHLRPGAADRTRDAGRAGRGCPSGRPTWSRWSSPSRPGPGCGRTCASSSRPRWRCTSQRSAPGRRGAGAGPDRPGPGRPAA